MALEALQTNWRCSLIFIDNKNKHRESAIKPCHVPYLTSIAEMVNELVWETEAAAVQSRHSQTLCVTLAISGT